MSRTRTKGPTLRQWYWTHNGSRGHTYLRGYVYHDPRFHDGTRITTTRVCAHATDWSWAQTQNTTYTLRERAQ